MASYATTTARHYSAAHRCWHVYLWHCSKFPSSIIASGDQLVKPAETSEFDFEVELVIVVGKAGRRIKKEDAMAHVAGACKGGYFNCVLDARLLNQRLCAVCPVLALSLLYLC